MGLCDTHRLRSKMSIKEVKDKTFLITGGGSGIGALYAEYFLKDGAKRIAILDVNEAAGKATEEKLNKLKPNSIIFVKCDVSNDDDLTAAFNKVVEQFTRVDVIINNAGIMDDSPAVWRKASTLNWQGLVSLTMKGLKHMRKDEGGSGGTIINISSIAALMNNSVAPMYHGTKSAVLQFSVSLAMDPFYSRTGIRILVLCPGGTDTPMVNNVEDKFYDPLTIENYRNTSYKLQKPESCAAACVDIFKTGDNGGVYLSIYDEPPKNITEDVKRAYDILGATFAMPQT